MKSKAHCLSRRQKILVAAASILVVLAGWWAYVNFMPHPLGDKLEYIGKSDYGCPLICDANPGSTYYYGTDMSPEEVVGYFKGATIGQPSEIAHWRDSGNSFWLSFKNTKSNDSFKLIYYIDGMSARKDYRLPASDKKYLVKINDEDYRAAKDSL